MSSSSGANSGRAVYDGEFLDSAAFAKKAYKPDWLIDHVLINHQPAVIGGRPKTLKTSIALDMAISLASRKSFLDTFAVPTPRRVAVLSGESGPATINETANRICAAKSLRLKDCDVFWSFRLPRLDRAADRNALRRFLREQKIEIVIIDPLYLALGGKGESASNLFAIGPILYRAGRACLDCGATPVLIHHATKGSSRTSESSRPLALEELAFAGITEYARQWLLLSRRIPYREGSGLHELYLVAGGSAGHSGRWALEVQEGVISAGRQSREWRVKVSPV